MAKNRGKDFEDKIKEAFEKIEGVSIDRLHDQTNGYKGSQNICDFIVYKLPFIYYLECKSVHGNTFPFSNITDTQWNGLLQKSKIYGVTAGIIIWWIDRDITKFIPITELNSLRNLFIECKSIRYDEPIGMELKGKKKRVFFDYDMNQFFKEVN